MNVISPSTMQLGEQIAHLAVIATVSAWIAWLWTHEEIFKDVQDFLKSEVTEHKSRMKDSYHAAQYGQMLRHWAIQKVCFGLTCQTCVVHYPNLIFVVAGHYRLISTDGWGFMFAWMFTAFTGDSVLWLLGVMRKGQRLEEATGEALEAGAELLKRKVEKNETSDVMPVSRIVTHAPMVEADNDGRG